MNSLTIMARVKFFSSGAEGLSVYHLRFIPVELTFAWVGYSISRDRHKEAMLPSANVLLNNAQMGLGALG